MRELHGVVDTNRIEDLERRFEKQLDETAVMSTEIT